MKKYNVEVWLEDNHVQTFETTYFNLTDTVKELNNPNSPFIEIGNMIVLKMDVRQIIVIEKKEEDQNAAVDTF